MIVQLEFDNYLKIFSINTFYTPVENYFLNKISISIPLFSVLAVSDYKLPVKTWDNYCS